MALPPPGRTLRAIGFDDVPWRHRARGSVGVVGAVCAGTRFEGMLYGSVQPDGWRATLTVERLLLGVHGADPREIASALGRLTDTGNVPEALRLAHLIGGAFAYGESRRRA